MSRLLSPGELIAAAKQRAPRPVRQAAVSIEDSEAAALAYANHYNPDDLRCADPFDIIAAIEEELGHPLYRS